MTASSEKNSRLRPHPFEGLESPFLEREPDIGQGEDEWEPRLSALEAEGAFQNAFEHPWVPTGIAETESAGSFSEEFEFEEQGIVGGDNRIRVKDTIGVPWRWICKIFVVDSQHHPVGGGTGVLISNKHVLTAAHVVYDAFKNMHQYTITVVPALDDLQEPFEQYALASKPRIRKEYDPAAADNLDWDYALLTLSTSVGEMKFKALKDSPLCYWASPQCGADTVFARLDPRTLNGRAAYTAGYPGGKGGRQLWCAAGILHSADEKRRTMWTTADTTHGQSGSPVWVVDNKLHALVGVAAGVGARSNVVVRVTRELISQLRTWITAEGETASMIETETAFEPPILLAPKPEAEDQPYALGEGYEPPAAEGALAPAREDEAEFAGAAYEESEPHPQAEQPLVERFDPTTVPQDVADALGKQDWPLALKLAIKAGWRDENELDNLIFFARHPELPPEPLKQEDPNFKQLSVEWTNILEKEIWNAIRVSAENTLLAVSGKEVIDHHRSFFRGNSGKRLRKLVEDAAREVDVNPGLLGTIMMAETRRPLSYLSSEKVSSYHIGCDDFYEARAAIQVRVPAYAKVNWDRKQTPAEHLNDAKKKPRLVKTILFDSGPDAALATAVYVKFREARLREIAAEMGKDFDSLPLPTRFALTRMAMAAGTGGATPYLKNALNGMDIFVRQAIPVREYQTRRNATVRTAQAMHLSDWIFGIPVEPATRPAVHELESRDEEQPVPNELEPSLEEESGEGSEAVEFKEASTEYDIPDTSTHVIAVGQRVELDVTKTVLGANLDKVKWSIPGKVVGGYEGTVSQATLIKVTSADLERPQLSFFWVNAAKGRKVRAKIKDKSGAEREFVAVFDVEGPTLDSFSGDPGETRLEKEHGTLQLQFGKPIEAPGIRWNWKITLPPHHAGYIKDVQTVLMDRTKIQYLEPGGKKTRTLVQAHPSKTKMHVQIDTDSHKDAAYTLGLGETKIEGGQSMDTGRGTEDSPSSSLASLDKTVSINDQFTYYVMFKPDTDKPEDAIWVPVGIAKWSWKATAEQRDKKWSLRKSPKMEPDVDKATVEFPVYHSNASENDWQEAPPAASREQSDEQDNNFAGEFEQTEASEE